MSMEVKGNYGGYSAGGTGSVKSSGKAEEKAPEMVVQKAGDNEESRNRDVVSFSSTGVYPHESYDEYLRRRLEEVAKAIPDMAKNYDQGETVTFSEWYGKSVTISDESKQILAGVSERKAAQRAATEALKAEQPDNAFFGTGGMRAQHRVFGDYLYENGFFDDMDEDEARAMQGMLHDMTDGMNKLNGGVLVDLGSEMSHEAARLELISSVNALRHFSEKFVPEEMQGAFNALIDQYESYNGARVAEHKNIYDMRDESMKDMPLPNAADPAEAAAGREIGRVTHTAEQKKANEADYQKLFDDLRQDRGSVGDVFENLRRTLMNYASGGSGSSAVMKLLESRNSSVLKNMESYWSRLMQYQKPADEEEAPESV